MERIKKFFDRLAESNREQFGPGRLKVHEINPSLWTNNLTNPHLQQTNKYDVCLDAHLPYDKPVLSVYEAMKLADVIFRLPPKECIFTASPYQAC